METLVGTGVQGHDTDGGQQGLTQEISSPWDLCMGSSLGMFWVNYCRHWLVQVYRDMTLMEGSKG